MLIFPKKKKRWKDKKSLKENTTLDLKIQILNLSKLLSFFFISKIILFLAKINLFIQSYPRTVADSMRRKETKRKEKREEYKKRKDLEKTKIKEEIKRLKSLKRKEIENKIEKLKKISGLENMKITVEDLEKDFDPEEYDKKIEVNNLYKRFNFFRKYL